MKKNRNKLTVLIPNNILPYVPQIIKTKSYHKRTVPHPTKLCKIIKQYVDVAKVPKAKTVTLS